jgi:hypothetical protein
MVPGFDLIDWLIKDPPFISPNLGRFHLAPATWKVGCLTEVHLKTYP